MMKISLKYPAIALMLAASAMAPIAAAEAPAQEISVAQTPQVSVHPGQIVIEVPGDSPCHVAVYSLTGQVVRQLNAAPGTTQIDLPSGHYIVRIGSHAVKVVVK